MRETHNVKPWQPKSYFIIKKQKGYNTSGKWAGGGNET